MERHVGGKRVFEVAINLGGKEGVDLVVASRERCQCLWTREQGHDGSVVHGKERRGGYGGADVALSGGTSALKRSEESHDGRNESDSVQQ